MGSSTNTYAIEWTDNAKSTNYTITEKLGKLTVYENKDEIVVRTIGGTYTYTGNAYHATVKVEGVPEGYSVAIAKSDASVTDVTREPVTVTSDHLSIVNAQGEDVTSKLSITKVDGSIVVVPKPVTVETASASKTYNGKPLTAGGTLEGLVEGETVKFSVTGTQTAVGSSTNTYAIEWTENAKSTNYTITEKLGKLEVIVRLATITANSTSKYYDEKPLTDNGWTEDNIADDDVVASVEVTGSQLYVGSSDNKASNALIMRDGEDVTGNYSITYVPGLLIVRGGSEVNPTLVVTKTHESKSYKLNEVVTFNITVKNIYDEAKTINVSE